MRGGDLARFLELLSDREPPEPEIPDVLATIVANQQLILANQQMLLANQRKILAGQRSIVAEEHLMP